MHRGYFYCLQNLKKILKTFSDIFFSFFRHKPFPSATGDAEINGMVSASKIYQSNGKMVTERANCEVGNKDHSKGTKYQVSRGEGIFNSIDHIGLGGVEWGKISGGLREEITFKVDLEGFPWTVEWWKGVCVCACVCVRVCVMGTERKLLQSNDRTQNSALS